MKKPPGERGLWCGGVDGGESVGVSVGGLGIARHGLNVLNVDASAIGAVVGGLPLLHLELELEELDFLLLAHDCEFGLTGGGALRLAVLVLAVEDEPGEEVAAEADELGLCGVVAVEGVFVGFPGASVAAVATGDACAGTVPGFGVVDGVASAVDAEVTGVSGGSGEGDGGGAGEESSGGESLEGHGCEEREEKQGWIPDDFKLAPEGRKVVEGGQGRG